MLLNIHTMECYLVIRNKQTSDICNNTDESKTIKLMKTNHKQKRIYSMIPLYKVPRKANVTHWVLRCLCWKCHVSGSGGKSSWTRFPGILLRCHAREWSYPAPSRPAHLPASYHCMPSVCNKRLAQPSCCPAKPVPAPAQQNCEL